MNVTFAGGLIVVIIRRFYKRAGLPGFDVFLARGGGFVARSVGYFMSTIIYTKLQ